MKKIMNITTHWTDLERYKSREELREFYKGFGLDGLELLESGEDPDGIIGKRDVVGVHLKYFPCWYCVWSGDWSTVETEIGDEGEVKAVFGGTGRREILESFQKNLAFAKNFSPEYAVFHVSDVLPSEMMTRRFRYSDEEIVDAAAELLNQLLPKDEGFELLLENLWWPGLTMTRPEITERLLTQIKYPRKGIMLDVGHLLHTNPLLKNEEQGAEYLKEILRRYEDPSIIRGIHYHQTLNGEYVERMKRHPLDLKGIYREKVGSLAEYVYQIDSHKPFLNKKAAELVKELSPEYLVFELISGRKDELAGYLRQQTECFK